MSVVHRHIETADPWGGLPPRAINIPAVWIGMPAASASNNVITTANYFTNTATAGANYSIATATAQDHPRNLVVRFTPSTASASLYAAGTVKIYGWDYYQNTVSESKAVAGIVSASSGATLSVNFARVGTVSVDGLQFAAASSTARSDVSFYVGQGQKLGLPVYLQSTFGAVPVVYFGTTPQTITNHSDSTSANQYTIVTGPYSVGGVSLSSAMNSASILQIHYKVNGRSVPYETGRHE